MTARDDVIAGIYAAAIEPEGLGRIADLLKRYLDADSAGVWLTKGFEVTEITQTQDIADSVGPYLDYYRTLDPWTAAPKTPGLVYLSSDSVDEAALVESEFYRDFARHFGMLRPMGLLLETTGDRAATFAINRAGTANLLDNRDRALLQDLVPHLRGALMLRSRFQVEVELRAAQSSALDRVNFGVMLCTADGRIVDMNQEAVELTAAGCGIAIVGNVAVAVLPEEVPALRTAIFEASTGEAPKALRLRSPGRDARLSVLAMPVRRRFHEWSARESCVLYLQRSDASPGLGEPLLMALFGLSPAQAGLCMRLLAGDTFEEAAAGRGIATSTARSHFLAALRRTGAENLRDLLRLLSALPNVRG